MSTWSLTGVDMNAGLVSCKQQHAASETSSTCIMDVSLSVSILLSSSVVCKLLTHSSLSMIVGLPRGVGNGYIIARHLTN